LFNDIPSSCPPSKNTSEESAATSDESTVDSSDDVPSRCHLKTTSQQHAEAQLLEELKSKKKRIKKKRPPSRKDSDNDDIIQADLEPQAVTPNIKNFVSSSKRQSGNKPREEPIDRVQAFLTEVPSLE
jgi:hypothetical protein